MFIAYRNAYYEVVDEAFPEFKRLLAARPTHLEQVGAKRLGARPLHVDYNVQRMRNGDLALISRL